MTGKARPPADQLHWSQGPKDAVALRWRSAAAFHRIRAMWRDNLGRAGHDLHSNTIVLGGILANYVSSESGYAYPAIELLSADAGWSRSTVERALKEGKENGWLLWCKPGLRETNAYRLAYSPAVVASVREHYRLRIEGAGRSIRSDLTWLDLHANRVGTDGSITSDLMYEPRQIRRSNHVRSDVQYSLENLTSEPHKGTFARGLGEEEFGLESPREDELPADLADDVRLHHDVLIALGGGDLELGRLHAEVLGRAQLAQLKGFINEVGLVASAEAIASATARAKLLIATRQGREASNVVA